jgi:hypothetical protein
VKYELRGLDIAIDDGNLEEDFKLYFNSYDEDTQNKIKQKYG